MARIQISKALTRQEMKTSFLNFSREFITLDGHIFAPCFQEFWNRVRVNSMKS